MATEIDRRVKKRPTDVFCDWDGTAVSPKKAIIHGKVVFCSKTCDNKSKLNKKIQGFNGILAANMVTDFMSGRQAEAFLAFLEAQGY